MIGVTMVTLLLVGQAYAYCEKGESNYTSIQYKTVYKEVEVKTSRLTSTEVCKLFWRWWCKTKTVTRYKIEKRKISFSESFQNIMCCPGFALNDSKICSLLGCKKGKFGDNCTKNCSGCPTYCDKDTGECLCDPGFMGKNCTEVCPEDKYGANCTHECRCSNNSTCNAIDGSCNCTSPGWRGALCDQKCANETYGLFCNETCACNENQTCGHVNGSCICKSGWHGTTCSEECGNMQFGVDCLDNCTCDHENTVTCDRETGYCHCKPGYKDVDCAQECEAKTFGENCSRHCSVNCSFTDYCDPRNGSCLCPGMRGPTCSEECDSGTFGPNCILPCNCSNSLNGTCHNFTGQCTCMPGWKGRACDEKCANETYGLFCNETCACNENQTCDHVDGSCICKSGWHGTNCSEECEPGMYGPDCILPCNCTHSGNESCDSHTGLCACVPGWTGQTCETECEAGTFGQNCTFSCDCKNSVNDSCNTVDGQCACKAGWTGRQCDQKDSKHFDASHMSNNSDGFIEQNLWYLIFGLLALFILTTVIVTVVCIRRKNLCRSLFTRSTKRQSLILNSEENKKFNSSFKNAIPISNLSSEGTQNNYEEALFDKQDDIEGNHDAEIVSNGTCLDSSTKSKQSELAKTDLVVEDDYSVPDEVSYNEEQLDKSKMSQPKEELYNCTKDDAVASKDIANEYNTFKDVLKIQHEDGKRNTDSFSEEDYDVISHTGKTNSKKTKAKDLEHYSSFEQVRKLSLQNSGDEEDEDTYNELNEHLHDHKSAHINANQYHHISLKDKSIDGEKFDKTKAPPRISSQRQSNTSNKLAKQKRFSEAEAISEELEDDSANKGESEYDDTIIEEDPTEVIYDECDVDDNDREPISEKIESHKPVSDDSDKDNAHMNEVVYEECDDNDDERTSAAVYEDVDSESHRSESSEEEEENATKDKSKSISDQEKTLIKRSNERRRVDYEEFAL